MPIIEELQKAIRSKRMTQVGQACCGSRLLCGACALLAALNYLLYIYVLTLVYWFFQAIHSSFCKFDCFVQLTKYVLVEYQTICVNCFKSCGWKMFMDTIFCRSKKLPYNTPCVMLSVTCPLSISFLFFVPLHPKKLQ